jgi:oligopeptide/dipeptide ABC transporter ATP-binding protein
MSTTPLLEVRDLVQEFATRSINGRRQVVHAVSGVSLEVRVGETLGIVGESGSGKSTLARAILRVPPPKSGQVFLEGTDLTKLDRRELRHELRNIQMVFQDPFTSVDPKWRVSRIVGEPLRAFAIGTREERDKRVAEVLDLVGLDPSMYSDRYPRQLSGGQCQRVAIARALVLSPSLIICDEAVSSLDVLIQAQVLNLFERLREELGLAYLFIAHDLALVNQVSDRVAVMYMGKLCEVGPSDDLYLAPRHPYTAALLSSIPDPDPFHERVLTDQWISGEPPSPVHPPSGCRFRTRCPRAEARCAAEEPLMRDIGTDHQVACHFPLTPQEADELVSTISTNASDDASEGALEP